MTYNPRHANNKTFIGDVENPIAIGRKCDLWKNLDNEFYKILEQWRWHRAGLIPLDINKMSYSEALGVRYLIEKKAEETRIM